MTKKKKISRFWAILFYIGIGYCIFMFSKRILTDILVDDNAIHTKAVIINEQNYYPHQNVHPEFSYSYQFEVRGKKYTGDSNDKELQIRDSVEVKYNKHFPSLNKPVHPKD